MRAPASRGSATGAEELPMRIAILTNEYPPNVYGGAGVHVEYLTREHFYGLGIAGDF